MKSFCFIFSFYLLLLSWQPCQDLAAVKTVACAPAEVVQTHLHNDSPQPGESDDCSPFCFCSCCQVSTVYSRLNFPIGGESVVSINQTHQVFYQSDYSQQHSNSVWQPPRV